jgi:hypothetical protein
MLQKQNPITDRGWSKLCRWSFAGALLTTALGVSALRGAAQPASSTPPPAAEERPATSVSGVAMAPLPKFDLSYIPHNAKGVYGFRPSVLCYCSALQPFIAEFDAMLPKELPAVMGFKGEFDLKVEEIEEMTGIVEIKRMPNNTNALMTSFTMMRVTHDYDWAKRIKLWLPECTVHQHKGQNYFKAPKGFLVMLGMGLEPCAFVPDSRTIVCGDEAFIKGIIDNLGQPRPQPEWQKDWDAVDRCWLAVALDNRDYHLVHDLNKEGKPPMPLTPICEKAKSLVFGLEGGQVFSEIVKHADGTETTSSRDSNLIVTGRAQCKDEKSATEVKETIVGLFKQARDWAAVAPVPALSKNKPTAGQVLSELLNPQIEQYGTTVGVRAETKKSLIAVKLALDELDVHEDAKVEK